MSGVHNAAEAFAVFKKQYRKGELAVRFDEYLQLFFGKYRSTFDSREHAFLLEDLEQVSLYHPPVLRSEDLYRMLLEYVVNSKGIKKDRLFYLLVHQHRYEDAETKKVLEKYELRFNKDEVLEALYKPFKSSHLKNCNAYIISKLEDYYTHIISVAEVEERFLNEEIERKEFLNRVFYMPAQNFAQTLYALEEKERERFLKLMQHVLQLFTEKQQLNLIKTYKSLEKRPETRAFMNFLSELEERLRQARMDEPKVRKIVDYFKRLEEDSSNAKINYQYSIPKLEELVKCYKNN